MGKRMRREKSICCCNSPLAGFSWYEEDIWTEIAKHLDGKSLVMLGTKNKWFHCLIMEDSIWKFACLRDLQLPEPQHTFLNWIKLYASAFDGSHSFMFRQREKHIDLQLVRCPVCDLNTCDGTMQTLDARHIELFLSEGYRDGSWEYRIIGSHDIKKHADGASAGIFDIKHLNDSSTSEIFNLKSWVGKPNDWQPKAMITLHAVAINTNLQENEGLHVKYQAMKAGPDGEVVSLRISQQLL
ncbi:probable F-box protein At3g61730 isoform X2 [Vitis vinifera]|uniref:probable F-box protein At3g61730 isoform X2 n=1 Tax=Vitis vinifera TaxID=29760 RepID=UPI0008FECC1B|nr:probable F-box protein At3g61730 isoform X2 [Vitis vinifera]|eukprot:XP_019080957.1 PREDICTED: probable F-box protein At3g61730 isoform X2 [Vitis vinifera]